MAEPHEDEHDSSLEIPKLPESNMSDDGDLSGMNGRGRRRHRSRRSDCGSHGGFGAISQQPGRRVSPLNLRRDDAENDKDGNGGDAVENSEGINAVHHSSKMNEENFDFKNGSLLDDRRPFKQTASYKDL